jgi:hypothetical protein
MKRQCFWLQELEPEPNHPNRFRVCVVTENEPGYQPTGGGGGGEGDDYVVPWYWDHATCIAMNKKQFGVSEEEATEIVTSSMFVGNVPIPYYLPHA